ncbi:hypothetical protein [Imtechella halotolerans]|nr:hypothetical protein [Imtechella halotolerans]WMQ64021.1 hypothetical protein PT603_03385 [Imtechella halotolerans]
MKNKTDQIEEQSLDDTLLKMKKIKELSEENFVLLRPIEGTQEGYYLNYCRF